MSLTYFKYWGAKRKCSKLHQIALTSQVEPFADGMLNLVKIRLMRSARHPGPWHEMLPGSVHCRKCAFCPHGSRFPTEQQLTVKQLNSAGFRRFRKGVIVSLSVLFFSSHLPHLKKTYLLDKQPATVTLLTSTECATILLNS